MNEEQTREKQDKVDISAIPLPSILIVDILIEHLSSCAGAFVKVFISRSTSRFYLTAVADSEESWQHKPWSGKLGSDSSSQTYEFLIKSPTSDPVCVLCLLPFSFLSLSLFVILPICIYIHLHTYTIFCLFIYLYRFTHYRELMIITIHPFAIFTWRIFLRI